MNPSCAHGSIDRRRFLNFLAASPCWSMAPHALAQDLVSPVSPAAPPPAVARDAAVLTDPRRALNVFEFEPVMKNNVPPAHFG